MSNFLLLLHAINGLLKELFILKEKILRYAHPLQILNKTFIERRAKVLSFVVVTFKKFEYNGTLGSKDILS